MAEEKKKTTRKKATSSAKKVTAKAKSTAKKSTAKAKSTAKKTTAKAKSTAKKTTSTAKKVVKSSASTAKKPQKTAKKVVRTGKLFTLADWKKTAQTALQAWSSVGWRIFSLFLLFFAATIATLALLAGAYIVLFGGLSGLESQLANVNLGTPDIGLLWAMGLGFILLMTVLVVLSFLVNISTWLTLKNYAHGRPNNPITVFFRDAWEYLGRYTWLSVKIFFYIFLPLLGLILLGSLMGILFGAIEAFVPDQTMAMVAMIILGVVAVVLFFFLLRMLFHRWIEAVLMPVTLIESNASVPEVWSKSLALAQDNWGTILGAILLFAFPFWIIQVLTDPEVMTLYASDAFLQNDWLFGGAIALNVIFSLLIMTPITTAFLYGVTRHFSNVKNIKL